MSAMLHTSILQDHHELRRFPVDREGGGKKKKKKEYSTKKKGERDKDTSSDTKPDST